MAIKDKLKLWIFILVLNLPAFLYPSSQVQRLNILYNRGELGKAVSLSENKVYGENSSPDDYLNLALLYEEEGDYSKAVSLLKKADSLYREERDILFHLGRILCLDSKSKESIHFLKKYLSKNRGDKKAYFYLGLDYEDLGRDALALRYYRYSLRRDKYFVLPLLREAGIYLKKKDYFKAAAFLSEIKGYDPGIKQVYKDLAFVSLKLKNYLASFKEAGKFLSMSPKDKEAEKVIEEAKQRLGKGFFKREREKTAEYRQKKTAQVFAFAKGIGIPEIKVCISEGLKNFEFKVTGKFIAYLENKPVLSLEKGILYRIEAGNNKLNIITPKGAAIFDGGLVLVPESKGYLFGIFGTLGGKGSYYAKSSDGFFRGRLKIIVDGKGRMRLVNVVNLEEYLYGVLPSEIPSTWPKQAILAQAVLARTKALSGIGMYKGLGFDFYNTVRYQVYRGVENECKSAVSAVDATRGVILTLPSGVEDIYYSSNCGGHTRGYKGVKGVKENSKPLRIEFPLSPLDLYNWLGSEPDVFCSLSKNNKSRFRWQRIYTEQELSNLVSDNTDSSKEVREIRVLKRGISGHIDSLKIMGPGVEKEIDSELKIRRILGGLRSSLFRVEVKYGKDGNPEYFIFWGGGFGHGRGLCQYGAKGMADKGYSYQDILRHYFPGSSLKRSY